MKTAFSKRTNRRAFSLIELLVVIGIITLMAGLIGTALTTSGGATSVKASQRVLAGLVQSARTQALLKQQKVRLLIHADESDPSRYRRYAGLVYGSDTDGWIAVNDGTLLPSGAYFAIDTENSTFTSNSTISLQYPRREAKMVGTGDSYYYVEFNADGTVVTSPAPIIAVQAASLTGPATPGNIPLENDPNAIAAVVIHKLGSITFLDDADIIREQGL